MRKNLLFGLALTSASILNPVFATSSIDVSDAWVRAAPPNAKVMAGYFTLNNHSMQSITLTGASSPQFKSIEIHRSYMESGMMHMKEATPLTVEGHNSIHFEPGSYHLMLIKPVKKLKLGDNTHITLKFENSKPITIQMPVKKTEQDKSVINHKHGHH